MSTPQEIVKVATGESVVMELYKNALTEAGIEARVMGEALEAGLGTAIPKSVEVWVHHADADRALAVLQELEAERDRRHPPPAQ